MVLINKDDLLKRMSIGAPMNWTDSERELGEESQYKSDMLHIQCSPEVSAIPIPDKATNGDMIKAMFPEIEWEKKNIKGNSIFGYKNKEDVDKRPPNIGVELDWWNAPYKKE